MEQSIGNSRTVPSDDLSALFNQLQGKQVNHGFGTVTNGIVGQHNHGFNPVDECQINAINSEYGQQLYEIRHEQTVQQHGVSHGPDLQSLSLNHEHGQRFHYINSEQGVPGHAINSEHALPGLVIHSEQGLPGHIISKEHVQPMHVMENIQGQVNFGISHEQGHFVSQDPANHVISNEADRQNVQYIILQQPDRLGVDSRPTLLPKDTQNLILQQHSILYVPTIDNSRCDVLHSSGRPIAPSTNNNGADIRNYGNGIALSNPLLADLCAVDPLADPSMEERPIPTDRAKDIVPGTKDKYRTPGSCFLNKSGNIKRPMNAFMVWARLYRSQLAARFNGDTNSQISVKLGDIWNSLSREEKTPFYEEADRIKNKHKEEFPGWVYRPCMNKKRSEENLLVHKMMWARFNGGPSSAALASLANAAANQSPLDSQQSGGSNPADGEQHTQTGEDSKTGLSKSQQEVNLDIQRDLETENAVKELQKVKLSKPKIKETTSANVTPKPEKRDPGHKKTASARQKPHRPHIKSEASTKKRKKPKVEKVEDSKTVQESDRTASPLPEKETSWPFPFPAFEYGPFDPLSPRDVPSDEIIGCRHLRRDSDDDSRGPEQVTSAINLDIHGWKNLLTPSTSGCRLTDIFNHNKCEHGHDCRVCSSDFELNPTPLQETLYNRGDVVINDSDSTYTVLQTRQSHWEEDTSAFSRSLPDEQWTHYADSGLQFCPLQGVLTPSSLDPIPPDQTEPNDRVGYYDLDSGKITEETTNIVSSSDMHECTDLHEREMIGSKLGIAPSEEIGETNDVKHEVMAEFEPPIASLLDNSKEVAFKEEDFECKQSPSVTETYVTCGRNKRLRRTTSKGRGVIAVNDTIEVDQQEGAPRLLRTRQSARTHHGTF